MPRDDGVRMRVRVALTGGDSAPWMLVELEIKRVAAGQVWIEGDGQPLPRRPQDLAVMGP